MTDSVTEAPILAFEPNCRLKSELGEEFQLAEVIGPENIEACQILLDDALAQFFQEAGEPLNMLEKLVAQLSETSALEEIHTQAYHIRSHAKVLGLTLITEICVHVIAATSLRTLNMPQQHALLQKLVETLRYAFTHQIRDEGGEAGQNILRQLRSLR